MTESAKGTIYALLAVALVFISLVLKERIAVIQAVGMAIVLASVFLNVRLVRHS